MQKSLIVALALLLFATTGASAQTGFYTIDGKPASADTVEAVKLLQQSVPLLQSGRNQEAVDKLAVAVKLAPDMAEIHNNFGLGLAKVGRTDEAQVELEKAVQLKPTLEAGWMTLGGLYQSQGKIQKALETYLEFIRRFPNHPDVGKVKAIVQGIKKELADGTLTVESNQAPADNYINEIKGTLYRWPPSKCKPIRVYIAPGTGVPGFQQYFDGVLRESFDAWSRASNNLVAFAFVENAQAADIVCTWTGDPRQLANTAEAGETHISINSQGIVSGTIKLLTVPLMKALPVTENLMRQTCLHEIGHVLGFGGHTNNPADIMFFTIRITDRPPSLGERDANSVRRLYTSP